LRFLAHAWPSKDAAHYAGPRRQRRRLRDFPSKDPAHYENSEKRFVRWYEGLGPSKDPADYYAREKKLAWLATGPVRPPIIFYLLYAAAVATSIARAYVDKGSDDGHVLPYATIALFAASGVVLVWSHRRRWLKQQAL
jgi:hypothetical protein